MTEQSQNAQLDATQEIKNISETTIQRLIQMFRLQHENNLKQAGTNYILDSRIDQESAIIEEVGEALVSAGYKWWKGFKVDPQNLTTELVDIWHFLMSKITIDTARRHPDVGDLKAQDNIVNQLAMSFAGTHYQYFLPLDMGQINPNPNGQDYTVARAFLKRFLGRVLANEEPRVILLAFIEVLAGTGVSFTEFYNRYVAKNALNTLRDTYGYKTGEYNKQWTWKNEDGTEEVLEDNDYVIKLLSTKQSLPTEFATIYLIIEREYCKLFSLKEKSQETKIDAPKIQLV